MDAVQFLMSANVGEALKPIQKIASGGELARMLALKNVLAENDDVTTPGALTRWTPASRPGGPEGGREDGRRGGTQAGPVRDPPATDRGHGRRIFPWKRGRGQGRTFTAGGAAEPGPPQGEDWPGSPPASTSPSPPWRAQGSCWTGSDHKREKPPLTFAKPVV